MIDNRAPLPNSFRRVVEDGEFYVSSVDLALMLIFLSLTGTIRLWQTTPGKTYGLWQGNTQNGG